MRQDDAAQLAGQQGAATSRLHAFMCLFFEGRLLKDGIPLRVGLGQGNRRERWPDMLWTPGA